MHKKLLTLLLFTGCLTASAADVTLPFNLVDFRGTNYEFDFRRLFVTSSVPAFRGMYTQVWGGVTSGTGVWRQAKGTNLIYLRDPGGNHLGEEWTFEGGSNSGDYFYKIDPENPPFNRPHGVWQGGGVNPPWNGSISIGVVAGTNITRTNRMFYRAPTAYPRVEGQTNILRVEVWGDDRLANRSNGWPFKTFYGANLASTNGDVVLVGPGYFSCRSFYSHQGVTWRGAGQQATLCTFYSTNSTTDTNPNPYHQGNFSSHGFVLNSNVELSHLTLTNCSIIGSDNPAFGYDSVNCYVHDVTVIHPRTTPVFSSDSANYLWKGVMLKSVHNCTFENVKVFSPNGGIEILGSKWSTNAFVNLLNCFVICDRAFDTNAEANHAVQALALRGAFGKKGIQVNVSGGRYEARKGTNALNASIYLAATDPNWRLDLNGVELVAGTNAVPIRTLTGCESVVVSGSWTERQLPDDYAPGTNTSVANGFRFRTATVAPVTSELDWANGGTNGAMFWKSNGFVFLTTATNGTVTTSKIGP